MPRIVAIDYGAKRCGLAETDDLKLIASGHSTVHPSELLPFFKDYSSRHELEAIVVGLPLRMSGDPSAIEPQIAAFISKFAKAYPEIPVHRVDERFTSKMALASMIEAGARKKQRRNKEQVDKISATLILQQFLEQERNKHT